MLREIPSTRQRGDEPRRRWFTDRGMDLTLWQRPDGTLLAFQLAYDKGEDEHALEWRRGRGMRHFRVDDGESEPGRYKQSPLLLLPAGTVPRRRLIDQFSRRAGRLESGLREEILARLRELAG